MFNTLRTHITERFLSRYWWVFLCTFLYFSVFNLPVLIYNYQSLNEPLSIVLFPALANGLQLFMEVYVLIFALTIQRWVWRILWPLLCLFTALNVHLRYEYGLYFSKDCIISALTAVIPLAHLTDYLTLNLGVNLLAAFLLSVLGVWLLAYEKGDERNRRSAGMAIIVVVNLFMIVSPVIVEHYSPFDFLFSAYQSSLEILRSIHRKNIADYASSIQKAGQEPLTIVMVVGESARGDHFHINGYARETTPLLDKRKNLVNFSHTTSCDVWTLISVPCLLTRATQESHSALNEETSFVSVFTKLGFHTTWISNQAGASDYDVLHALAAEANEDIELNNKKIMDESIRDEHLLPELDKALDKQKDSLIVLHTLGSHWWYSDRYPPAFEAYPVQALRKTDFVTLKKNAYDNSILYTDYILDQVITRLEHKNALFLYTSDHGESLGENGKWLHGHEAPEVHNVPMFWWASDSFIKQHKEQWDALTEKSSQPSSHDVIFHSILDCAGVVSPQLIQPSLSLCRKAAAK